MTLSRLVSVALLTAAIGAGTLTDRPRPRPPLTIGGYRVLAVDFHNHSSMWSDSTLTPWGMVLEARRQGLDAYAATPHNATGEGKMGRWFSRLLGGPTVLAGEEITRDFGAPYHVIAAGHVTYAVLGLVGSYFGIYFYLRVIQLMFMSAEPAAPQGERRGWAFGAALACLAATVWLAVLPGSMLARF